ncbi:MAG: response regulator transcription factor [Candidatus Nanopelagicales bacterium]
MGGTGTTADVTTTPVRVMVVDDHPVVRSGLAGLISSDPGLELVASVESGERAIVEVGEPGVDVVLMDLQLGGMDGAEATRRVLEVAPEIAVVVLTASDDKRDILRAFDAGARGYVLKDASSDELIKAIHAAVRGESPMAWRTARALVDARSAVDDPDAPRPLAPVRDAVVLPYLSNDERDMLVLLREGLDDDAVADRLGVPVATVRAQLESVLPRLGVPDRDAAVAWVRQNL